MNLSIIQISGIAGLTYSIQNILEKTIFNGAKSNINDYFIVRVFFMLILFALLYFLFPEFLVLGNTKSVNNLIEYTKEYWALTLGSAVFVICSVYFMNLGLSTYDVSQFTPIYLLTYLIINIFAGLIIFKEEITIAKMLGLLYACVSIILFNLK